MLHERLLKRLKNHKEEVESLLLSGATIEDFNSYSYLIGKLKGIIDCIAITTETFKGGSDE